jgi:three-Cys-motif partner protein
VARSYDLDAHVQRVLDSQHRRSVRAEPGDAQLELFDMPRVTTRPDVPHATSEGLVVDDEMLFSRLVCSHSIVKSAAARAYAEIVGVAMGGKRWPLWWVELFAGPGRLLIKETGAYVPGSPIEALSISRPFDGYVFSDLSFACTESLRRRVGERPDVTILKGDANSAELLDQVVAIVPRNALLVLYSDPEGLDTEWATLKFFIDRHKHLDLLLNLPVSGIVRAITGGYIDKASSMLDSPDPRELLEPYGPKRGQILREYFRLRLEYEGFEHLHSQTIKLVDRNADLYDLLLASRHPLAERFFRAAVDASYRALAA